MMSSPLGSLSHCEVVTASKQGEV